MPYLLQLLISTLAMALKIFSSIFKVTSQLITKAMDIFHSPASFGSLFSVVSSSVSREVISFHLDAWKGRMSMTKE